MDLLSDQATAAVVAAATPYVKMAVVMVLSWAVGKAQKQGGPLPFILSFLVSRK